ncbi:site-specific integrase [Sunxiuqinia elliptica]|uniref:Site-specific recombinase XerD n=1 Tax=Sunxiuqinia elliptica TaxID=655355 RepID=A0A4R6GUM5_9BACT|nr:site-specific integrase [Sunxiuqinia elliptica]TDN98384.1 site-specific recombinase XerD [Sunxiuqinia elliptica]TDO60489.1 site-specific recombinase XerD [Sunxiuqinia elliptica]
MKIVINYFFRKSRKTNGGTSPVYVRFTFKNKRVELSTGIFVSQNCWDTRKQRIKEKVPGSRILNERLDKIRTEIQDIFNQLRSSNEEFDVNTIKQKLLKTQESKGILEIFDYYLDSILAKLNKGYSMETYKHYKSSRKRLSEFITKKLKRSDISVLSIDYKFLNAFDVFIKKNFNNSQNTAWNYHKHLRRVLNLAISMDYIDKNPYSKFKVGLNETHREILSNEELKRIEEKQIQIERLAVVRDIFVFACYTGLSFSDIAKLSAIHHQQKNDGREWIIIDRNKTNNRCRIPLLPKAKEILKKYEDYPKISGKAILLPVLTNQKMNSYLKELGDICNINKNITMHIARHTFATTVTLSNGVPIETVSKLLGHSSLKTTQIYAKVLDKKIAEDMELLESKLNQVQTSPPKD